MSDKGGLPCPYVSCGSRNAFSFNTDGYGKCHSSACGRSYPSRDEMFSWAKEKYPTAKGKDYMDYTPKDIKTVPESYFTESSEGKFVAHRGITADTMKVFNVLTYDKRTYLTKNGKEFTLKNAHEYVYPSGGVQSRLLEEKQFYTFGSPSDELFGFNLIPAGGKFLTICEGPLDVLSAWQMLKSSYDTNVVGFLNGSPSGKLFQESKAKLDSFEKIILSLDNDKDEKLKKKTNELVQRMSRMFPNKVYVMDHGNHKDANDFLQAGDQAAYKKAWWAARKVKIENLNVSTEDYLDLYDGSPDFEYFETGIPDLDSKILGICKGYFTVLLAQTGVGKTELLRYLEYQCLTKSDYKFAFMHLEESKLRSVLGLVSYDLNENLILPKYIAEKGMDKEVRESIGNLTKDERMIQFNYSPDDGYESLIDQVKFLKAAFDVDYVFFEPIQDLVNGSDKESKLADLSTRLGTLCSEIDVGIVTIAHQNKDGDTMYASMIGKKAAFEIVLDRDQESDDINIRNTTNVRVGRKNRVGNGNGPAGQLEFNSESYTLVPVVHDMTHTSRDDSDGIPF